jgi:hypothetical protein
LSIAKIGIEFAFENVKDMSETAPMIRAIACRVFNLAHLQSPTLPGRDTDAALYRRDRKCGLLCGEQHYQFVRLTAGGGSLERTRL